MRCPQKAVLWALCAAVIGCGNEPDASVELGLRVQALGGGLPADVASLRLVLTVGDESPQSTEVPLVELEASEDRRRLMLPDLPAETPLLLRVEALNAAARVAHVGVVGPLELGRGERLRAPVVLMPRETSTPLEGPPPRFLHTATRLDDGRVLIAGGFGAPAPAPCPSDAAAGSECYDLTALADAWLFDPRAAAFVAVADGMLEARGGHSATLLPDQRVLLAGGASHALLVLRAREGSLEPQFAALDAAGARASLASFELFDAKPTPIQAPRAPARGRFVGAAGLEPPAPGLLEAPRFLHAAAASSVVPSRVLLAGGVDARASAESYEIYDDRRGGGHGIIPGSLSPLLTPRGLPTALALADGDTGWIWLYGGVTALNNDELAERWTGNAVDAVGVLAYGTESAFPNPGAASADTPRPEYAFTRPLAVALAGGTHALVVGGVGPRCTLEGVATFPSTSLAADTLPCSGTAALTSGFVMLAATGATTPVTLVAPHPWGAAAARDDGSAAITGGSVDLGFNPGTSVELVQLEPAGGIRSQPSALAAARAFHTTTALFAGGLLSLGGVTRGASGLSLVSPVAEVLWP